MKRDSIPPEIENAVESELLADENLLWCGKPNALRRVFGQQGNWVWLLLMLPTLFMIVRFSGGIAALSLMVFLVGLAGFISALRNYFTTRNTIYAITDQRVLILSRGQSVSYGAKDLDKIERHGDDPGDIIFRETVRVQTGMYGMPISRRQPEGLFTIRHARQVEALLLQTFVHTSPSQKRKHEDAEDNWQALETPDDDEQADVLVDFEPKAQQRKK
ncbi:MAG: hypothetical protein K8L97_09720 [Anaerolineae bacterium]|nr:hypothetical protein [Anaerolineae bacterium]